MIQVIFLPVKNTRHYNRNGSSAAPFTAPWRPQQIENIEWKNAEITDI